MESDQAKLEIPTEADFAHLLNRLMSSGNNQLLGISSQEDYVLDTHDHVLFNAGLSLIIRKSRDLMSSNNFDPKHSTAQGQQPQEPIVTILLKEILQDPRLPFLKVHQREETCKLSYLTRVLDGHEDLQNCRCDCSILTYLLGRFPREEIRAIGSFTTTRHTFRMRFDGPCGGGDAGGNVTEKAKMEETVVMQLDRCMFYPARLSKFFCMFECTESAINRCLHFLQAIDVHFTVPLLPKTSLFFNTAAEEEARHLRIGPPSARDSDENLFPTSGSAQNPSQLPFNNPQQQQYFPLIPDEAASILTSLSHEHLPSVSQFLSAQHHGDYGSRATPPVYPSLGFSSAYPGSSAHAPSPLPASLLPQQHQQQRQQQQQQPLESRHAVLSSTYERFSQKPMNTLELSWASPFGNHQSYDSSSSASNPSHSPFHGYYYNTYLHTSYSPATHDRQQQQQQQHRDHYFSTYSTTPEPRRGDLSRGGYPSSLAPSSQMQPVHYPSVQQYATPSPQRSAEISRQQRASPTQLTEARLSHHQPEQQQQQQQQPHQQQQPQQEHELQERYVPSFPSSTFTIQPPQQHQYHPTNSLASSIPLTLTALPTPSAPQTHHTQPPRSSFAHAPSSPSDVIPKTSPAATTTAASSKRVRKRKLDELQELRETIVRLQARVRELETEKRVLEVQVEMLKDQVGKHVVAAAVAGVQGETGTGGNGNGGNGGGGGVRRRRA